MYIQSFVYKDEIWFLPAGADKIAILNTNNMQITYISIDFKSEYCNALNKYNSFIKFNDHFVCFVPRDVDEAIIVNMETKVVENYYKIAKENEEFQNAVLIDNMLYFYPKNGRRKVSLNLISRQLNYEEWCGNDNYGDAVYDKVSGYIYHAPARKNHILIDDIHGKILEKKIMDLPSGKGGYHTFYSSFYNNEILFWGVKGVISIIPKKQDIHYSQITEDTDGVILVPVDSSEKEAFVYGGNKIFQYDVVQERYITIDVTISYKELITQIEKTGKKFFDLYRYPEHGCEIENDPLSLNDFIYYLIQSNIPMNHIGMSTDKFYGQMQDFSILF